MVGATEQQEPLKLGGPQIESLLQWFDFGLMHNDDELFVISILHFLRSNARFFCQPRLFLVLQSDVSRCFKEQTCNIGDFTHKSWNQQ